MFSVGIKNKILKAVPCKMLRRVSYRCDLGPATPGDIHSTILMYYTVCMWAMTIPPHLIHSTVILLFFFIIELQSHYNYLIK